MNALPRINKISKIQQKSATSNLRVLETTHFVTHIEKIMGINVALQIGYSVLKKNRHIDG